MKVIVDKEWLLELLETQIKFSDIKWDNELRTELAYMNFKGIGMIEELPQDIYTMIKGSKQ